jgi:XTP/dITP diphosphohydrolase
MKVTLCFATNNQHKIAEISRMLGDDFEIQSLRDIGCMEELPENQSTLEGNSLEKARFVYDQFKIPCFADDTGLEVDALKGGPGVKSARYAGIQKNSSDNINLLLKNLKGENNRTARFRTVITLVTSYETRQFEGSIEGRIIRERKGDQGFGYDPVFVPNGYEKTFAELNMDEKNRISHRGLAIAKLVEHLKTRPIS